MLKQKLENIVSTILGEGEFFLVDLNLAGTGKQKVTVLIDGDNGLPIEKCAEVSRRLGAIVEEENLIDVEYTLEVSSPGVDFPISGERQYKKNIGRTLSIVLKDDAVRSGKLKEVRAGSIVIEEQLAKKADKNMAVQESEIAFEQIKKTNIVVSFK